MQIKVFTVALLWLFSLPLAAAGGNLLTEWTPQKNAGPGKRLLPEWRFSDWGKRRADGKIPARKVTTALVDGKVQVTLENTGGDHAVNILFRTYPLALKERKLCRLKVRLVNDNGAQALMKLQLSGSGVRNVAAATYAAVGKEPVEKEVLLTLPEDSRNLQVIMKLLGEGKVTISSPTLTLEEVPQAPRELKLSAETVLLPERIPVEFSVILPATYVPKAGDLLKLTLPWGVRLVNVSNGVKIKDVSLKVRSATTTAFEFVPQRMYGRKITFLLASDLKGAGTLLPGTAVLEEKAASLRLRTFFKIKTVTDTPALPPRHLKIALSPPEKVISPEVLPDIENALLRSGANILVSPRMIISEKQMKVAKMSRSVYVPFTPVKSENHCYYSSLRDESFWGKHYIPALRRSILQFGCRRPDNIIFDSFLGQRRAINCLCSICRTELCEFSPALPKEEVMNLSAGILGFRRGRELQRFRNARLASLWAGAKLHIPVDSRNFSRRPNLISLYPLSEALLRKPRIKTAEAAIDFGLSIKDPGGSDYNPALNFAVMKHVFRDCRLKFPDRTLLTAKITPRLTHLSEEQLQFEILNYFLAGFKGLWINLPEDAGYQYRRAVAEAARFLREHENFIRRGALKEHSWHLADTPPAIAVPPFPGPSEYPLALPRSAESVTLLVFKSGSDTLILAGNFTPLPVNVKLKNARVPLKWQGEVNGVLCRGAELRNGGVVLALRPYSWEFLLLKGI